MGSPWGLMFTPSAKSDVIRAPAMIDSSTSATQNGMLPRNNHKVRVDQTLLGYHQNEEGLLTASSLELPHRLQSVPGEW